MKKRRGQAMIFFVLGIVLVIVFAFAFYARSLLVTDKAQHEANQLVTEFIGQNNINYYVESCLQTVTDEALREFALHGGRINFTGTDEIPMVEWEDYYVLYKDTDQEQNISYGTLPNDCSAVSPDAPDYPAPAVSSMNLDSSYAQADCRTQRLAGYFGMSGLLPLCDPEGANSRITQDFGDNFDYYCMDGTYSFFGQQETAIQYRLQEHIKNEMDACTDFFTVYEDAGYDITTLTDQASFTAIYTTEGVTVEGHYPFLVRVRGQNVRTMHDFTYHSPLKFKQLYEYAARLLQKENADPDFDLATEYEGVLKPGDDYEVVMKTELCEQDVCEDAFYNDIVNITEDTNQNDIYGDPEDLTFRFAIKNRRPFLDYINEGDPEYDIKLREGEFLTLQPMGYDPDGRDIASYTYAGWKQNYDEYTEDECLDRVAAGTETINNCPRRVDSEPDMNWMNSNLYQETHREARIQLLRQDIGPHELTITIADVTGLIDYQHITVLVYDLPLAVPQGDNQIDGLDNSYASIEDSYVLDATESTGSAAFNTDPSRYFWTFKEGLTNIGTYETENNRQTIPDSTDISQYKSLLPKATNPDPLGVEQSWELVVQDDEEVMSEAAAMEMKVFACIPYTEANDDNMMYPYASYAPTAYDHVCCEGEIENEEIIRAEYVSATAHKTCYEATEVGLLKDITINRHEGTQNGGIVSSSDPKTPVQNILSNPYSSGYNDPYERSITRYCSGDRGNICSGTIENAYIPLDTCNDFDVSGQEERCQGGTDAGTCFNYLPKQSFEKNNHLNKRNAPTSANGICLSNWRPSTGDGGEYGNSNGHQSCQATCDGQGGCTEATNCKCVKNQFGAVCGDNDPFARIGNWCYSRCDSSCDYAGGEPCPSVAYCTTDTDKEYVEASCDDERPSLSSATIKLSGSRSCDADGCSYSDATEIPANYCSANENENSYCPIQGIAEDGFCYYGDRSCDAYGNCNMGKALATCPEGQEPDCRVDGFTCI